MEKETNQCKLKEIELIGGQYLDAQPRARHSPSRVRCLFWLNVASCSVVLEREREETKEAESSVAALRRRVSSQHEAIAALDAEIEQYRARAANLRKGPFRPVHLWLLRSHRPS
jgi:hypothetical protein